MPMALSSVRSSADSVMPRPISDFCSHFIASLVIVVIIACPNWSSGISMGRPYAAPIWYGLALERDVIVEIVAAAARIPAAA